MAIMGGAGSGRSCGGAPRGTTCRCGGGREAAAAGLRRPRSPMPPRSLTRSPPPPRPSSAPLPRTSGRSAGVDGHPHPDRLPRLPGIAGEEGAAGDREAAGHSAGWQMRKQAAVTLRCMQALVRVQARMSTEGQVVQRLLEARRGKLDPLKEAEGWCDSRGTVEEVRAKLQMRHQGAVKRERAIAYALSQQQSKSTVGGRSKQSSVSSRHSGFDQSNGSWSWLERWMAAKPWENRLMMEHKIQNM
ncbi:hypothetical protein BHM03_00049776 [Ensete ventricosum]|nr:hypothetical protein BHM03_00049776 [Ensete ventricosum]